MRCFSLLFIGAIPFIAVYWGDSFHYCLLGMFCSVLQCFSSLKFSLSLFSWLKTLCAFESSSGISGSSGSSGSGSSTSGSSGCFSCLYSSWSIFIPRLQWLSGLWSSSYFAAKIVKRSDDTVYQLHFVSPSLKLFCICTEAVWFWVQSNLSWKIQPLRWNSLCYFLDIFQINPFMGFLGFEICCCNPATGARSQSR